MMEVPKRNDGDNFITLSISDTSKSRERYRRAKSSCVGWAWAIEQSI